MTNKELDEFVRDYGFCPADCVDEATRQEARMVYDIFERGNTYAELV